MRLPVRPNRSSRGFTLIELMITVVIMAVLATVAVYGVTRYIAQSKTSEATRMLGDIKSAQEEYKNDHGSYLDVTGNLATFYPTNSDPGQIKVAWGEAGAIGTKFQALSVSPAGPVLFQYAVAPERRPRSRTASAATSRSATGPPRRSTSPGTP